MRFYEALASIAPALTHELPRGRESTSRSAQRVETGFEDLRAGTKLGLSELFFEEKTHAKRGFQPWHSYPVRYTSRSPMLHTWPHSPRSSPHLEACNLSPIGAAKVQSHALASAP